MKILNDVKLNETWNQFINGGNLDSLSLIYSHYYDLLFAYGLKHTQDKQAVEDAIQNVFISLIKFRKTIDDVKNLSGYLISAFRRQLFLDHNKQTKTIVTDHIPEENFDFFKSPEQDISDKEDQEKIYLIIKNCVSNLTSKQQEIIYLRFESGISYEEIAQMLHITVDSCYKSVYRSVRAIRSDVEKILGKGGNLILWFWSHLAP